MSIYSSLYDWQKKLVDSIKEKKSYGIWLDMGLGKTPISLSLCEQNAVEKVLIITLNSKCAETVENEGSWPFWASKADPRYKISGKRETSFYDQFLCYIVNYEWLSDKKSQSHIQLRSNILSFIDSCKGKRCAVIVDESHRMKDTSSLQTKCINMIYTLLKKYSSCCYLYLLTGTPFTQGYIDLYSQLKILGMPMNKGQFKERFCLMGSVPGLYMWQQPIVGYKNVDELLSLVHKYALTIETKEVIQLPDQIFSYHRNRMSQAFKMFLKEKAYGKEIDEMTGNKELEPEGRYMNPYFRNMSYPDFFWSADTAGQFWLRARELSIGFQGNGKKYQWYDRTRLDSLEKFLRENEDNYVLFYSYTPELIAIYEICQKLAYNVDIYSGDIKSLVNYETFSRLPENERIFASKKNIIITNWTSGSTGMNFQAYNKCIVFDIPVYRDWQQGLKRIHRTGQKNTCIYHIFCQNNFLDEKMLEAIKERKDYNKEMFEKDRIEIL